MSRRRIGDREGEARRRGIAVGLVLALALAVLGALVLSSAGGSDGAGRPDDFAVVEGVEPLGDQRAGSAASLVDCDDWSGGSVERKRATVIDVREQLTAGGTVAGRPSLTDQEAYDLFERACSAGFTGAFRLYKLYYDANAFQNLDPSRYSPDQAG